MKKETANSNRKITASKLVAGLAASVSISLNMNGCVYGPPESRTSASDDLTKPETTVEDTTFDTTENVNVGVYGPPESVSESE